MRCAMARLSWQGVSRVGVMDLQWMVRVDDYSLRTRLEITTPSQQLRRGRDPLVWRLKPETEKAKKKNSYTRTTKAKKEKVHTKKQTRYTNKTDLAMAKRLFFVYSQGLQNIMQYVYGNTLEG